MGRGDSGGSRRRDERSIGEGRYHHEDSWLYHAGGGARLPVAPAEPAYELKDYEGRLCAAAEAFVYAAIIRLMARRLARS